MVKNIVLRANDASSTNKITLYHDINAPVAHLATWFSRYKGQAKSNVSVLTSNYLFLATPLPGEFRKN